MLTALPHVFTPMSAQRWVGAICAIRCLSSWTLPDIQRDRFNTSCHSNSYKQLVARGCVVTGVSVWGVLSECVCLMAAFLLVLLTCAVPHGRILLLSASSYRILWIYVRIGTYVAQQLSFLFPRCSWRAYSQSFIWQAGPSFVLKLKLSFTLCRKERGFIPH